MSDDKKPSIWNKIGEATSAVLDSQIAKAKGELENKSSTNDDTDFLYAKTITDEPSFQINSQGYKEKPHRILNSHLKQMALKNSIVASIIQTRQNQLSNHSKLVDSEQERGFMIVLKDEASFLRKIKEEIAGEVKAKEDSKQVESDLDDESTELGKASAMPKEVVSDRENEEGGIRVDSGSDADTSEDDDDDAEEFNWELERQAREKLEEVIRDRRKYVEDFIVNSGRLDQRPFETKKWNFDSTLRAWARDTLTYDFMTHEMVPDKKGDPHHFFPTDSSTIKFASPALKKYKMWPGGQTNLDFLYPEKQIEALEAKDVLELDEDLLDKDKYKYVQVVRGRIERAYTEDEMKSGMRNMTTDLYNNGYAVAELELLVSLVSSHLNTEYYNKAYFTQGFSAKGILHLKAPIPRRKLETIRQQWHHMIRGTRNSFQTPIFAGMDEVNWIPLTQNHSDIEFSGWMNYLIKMICAVYQIDPSEIGIGMKDEGGGGLGGDNTKEKLNNSKDKGLYPLLRYFENYINKNVIDMIDSDFVLKFTGMTEESSEDALNRQKEMSQFALTVNEIRQELGKPPLPGMDDIILSDVYMNWYDKYSKKGQEVMKQEAEMNMQGQVPGAENGEESDIPEDTELDDMLNATSNESEDLGKSLKVEYYNIGK